MQSLQETIDRLAAFEPVDLPVISLYLNMQPDEHGRDRFEAFVRNELKARTGTFEPHSAERESLERDAERIEAYLAGEVRPSANGLAVFACAGAGDFFEVVQLDAPMDEHRLYLYNQPHLYHLARMQDQFPRYAAVVVDSHVARIFVFELGERTHGQTIENEKPKRHKQGGWSQKRYQRNIDNLHMQHAKEVVDVLERLVRQEGIQHVVFAGDEVILPTLREQLSQELAGKVVDVVSLDIRAPEHEVLQTTLDVIREQDGRQDADKVQRLFDNYRSGGLGAVGVRDTLEALTRGQVDELLISSQFELRRPDADAVDASVLPVAPAPDGEVPVNPEEIDLADEFVTRARATGATVTFIEDTSLLDNVGGVGALLRFRL